MSLPAARMGDATSHPGLISGSGNPTVLIEGRPAAALGDLHTCAMPPLAGPRRCVEPSRAARPMTVPGSERSQRRLPVLSS